MGSTGCETETTAEAEKKNISETRLLVLKEDPLSKEIDEDTIRRFLRAREMDPKKASLMLLKYLKWKRNFLPNGSISTLEVQNDIAQNKMFMQGSDKRERPIGVCLGCRHFQGRIDDYKRFIVYVFDRLIARSPEGVEKFVLIVDLKDWSYANSDMRANFESINIMQNYYPERLHKAFIVHVPRIFMSVWKLVRPIVDKNTARKIIFVDDKNLKSTLLEEIDKSQLPELYGGKLKLVPIGEADKA